MRCFDGIGWLCGAVIGLLLCGCAGMQTGPEPGVSIGTLRVIVGSEAYVNGKKAFDGKPIYSGDNVATGAGTSAVVNFPDGGFIELDEQTDPTIRQYIEQGICIISYFFQYGNVYGEKGEKCSLKISSKDLTGSANTRFNLETRADHSTLTVISGTIYLRLEDGERAVHAGQQAVVIRHRLKDLRYLSPEELRRVTSWRRRLAELPGWCCDKGKLFRSDREGCGRSGGVFFAEERSAHAKCRPAPPPDNGPGPDRHPPDDRQGWCCDRGKVFSSNREGCDKRGGVFSVDQHSAQVECRTTRPDGESPGPDRPGWCCDNGKIVRSDRENCKQRGGTFFVNERTARDECKISGPDDKRAFCDQYAKKAVSQNKENIRRKCGYRGAQWKSNADSHFNWCMKADRAAAESETRIREADLKRCGSGSSKPQDGMEKGTDRPGSDYRDFDLKKADPGLCRDACMKEKKCRAWTYMEPGSDKQRAHCWLKHSVPPPRKDRRCISGVKPAGPD